MIFDIWFANHIQLKIFTKWPKIWELKNVGFIKTIMIFLKKGLKK